MRWFTKLKAWLGRSRKRKPRVRRRRVTLWSHDDRDDWIDSPAYRAIRESPDHAIRLQFLAGRRIRHILLCDESDIEEDFGGFRNRTPTVDELEHIVDEYERDIEADRGSVGYRPR